MTDPTDVTALGGLVAAEDAAAFGLSAYGGRVSNLAPGSAGTVTLATAYDVHRLRRDAWSAALRRLGAAVPDAAAAYALAPVGSVAAALGGAGALEIRCADAYATALAGLADRVLRAQVTAALIDSARRSAGLLQTAGAAPAAATRALPGQDG